MDWDDEVLTGEAEGDGEVVGDFGTAACLLAGFSLLALIVVTIVLSIGPSKFSFGSVQNVEVIMAETFIPPRCAERRMLAMATSRAVSHRIRVA